MNPWKNSKELLEEFLETYGIFLEKKNCWTKTFLKEFLEEC